LDREKECLWLTDYIYVNTLYTTQPSLFWCMPLYPLSSWKWESLVLQ